MIARQKEKQKVVIPIM